MEFDKYHYYREAVQNPQKDAEFIRQVYREHLKKDPKTLREDFCGTFSLCCEWVRLDPEHQAIGVDLDLEPIEYGKKNYLPKLSPEQFYRVNVLHTNVLNPELPTADVVAAFNFSYFLFKEYEDLKEYFAKVYQQLPQGSLFMLDIFGGFETQEAHTAEVEHDDFTYIWDQVWFDPVTYESRYCIHFKIHKEAKTRERVFDYEWKIWTIPEIRRLLKEVGFSESHVYWEGTTEEGEGDGNFQVTQRGEDCDTWVAYIAAVKR